MGEILEAIESFISMPDHFKSQLMDRFMVDAFQIPFSLIATKIHKTTFRGLMDWGQSTNLDPLSLSEKILSEVQN
jgi:hypothetical protein